MEIGGSFAEDCSLEGGGKMEIDPGLTMNLGGNFRITDWLKVGPSLGLDFNYIDAFEEYRPRSDAQLLQMPLLFHVTLEAPEPWIVKPFVGAGVGGSLGVLTSFDAYYYDYWYSYGETDSDTDFSLAWQLSAGLRWQMDEQWSFGVVYRFLNVEGQDWTFHDFTGGWRDVEFGIAVDRVRIHSFAIQAVFAF